MEGTSERETVRAVILGPGDTTRDLGGTQGFRSRITGDETGGSIFIADGVIPPRQAGPPLHVHSREDELYLVIEGKLTVQVADELSEIAAGGLAWLPRGIPHTFANRTESPVRTIGIMLPTGIEDMFAEMNAYLGSLQGEPPDHRHIAEIQSRFGLKTVGAAIAIQ